MNKKNDDSLIRKWYLINLEGKILGRTAVEIAHLLMGKVKPSYIRSADVGDYVVVTNAKKVRVTGAKEIDKEYIHHTGYPQGLRKELFWELQARKPEKIIYQAVIGMLPKNKLRARMLKRLYIYPGDKHPYADKFK